MKPIPLQEQEYRQTLLRLEQRAIIPLKWFILIVTSVLWTWIIVSPPRPSVFSLFLAYFCFNCVQTYFFYFSTVTIHQVKPLTLISYLVDVVFVTLLIYFDLATNVFGPTPHTEFYLLYFLLVMRGFALFKSIAETIFVNFLMSILFIMTVWLQRTDLSFLQEPKFAISLVLIWLVILMSWLIYYVIIWQKNEIMEVHDRLMRADNLAHVGELAAGVAHEINNPIGIIAVTAEYLKLRTPAGDDRLEDIEAIHREAMRCKDIVQEMMTYANPRPLGISLIEPCVLNDEVLYFAFPRQKADHVEVVREYEAESSPFKADPNLIKQALLNLYINARQAIPRERDGRIVSRILNEPRGRKVRIEIEDNGMGIAADDLNHIFEPFFTRKEKGTGLGLAVTQRIVEMFGGTISVRSAVGQGTTFMLEFPAAAE